MARLVEAFNNMTTQLKKSIRFFLVITLCWLSASPLHAASAPNIILILADDQAWNGTSVQMHPAMPNSRSDFYQTPRLEQLAQGGMRFYNGYSSQHICTPTRAAILTGRSPAQLQMTELAIAYPGTARWSGHQDRMPLTPPAAEPLQPDVFTLPQILHQTNSDYVTAHFGKWHLNDVTGLSPEDVGYTTSVSKAPYQSTALDPKRVFHLANSAGIFMEENVASDKPFFLQLSHFAVHDPVESRQEIRDKYAALPPGNIHKGIPYAAMTEDLDASVGMVLDKLDQLGIRDNTYVIYTSDNGAPGQLSNSSPLYRTKAELREGGIRVPFIVSGPGIAGGTFSDIPVTTTDLFTTIANLAGFSGELPSNVEGGDFSPALFNGGSLPAGMDHIQRNFHEGGEIYWHSPQNFGPGPNYRIKPSSAIRDGDFKLYVEYGENGNPDVVYLHNLATHISEQVNLASSMPAKVAEMRAKLDNYLEQVDASFAYDVKVPILIDWNADHQGNVPGGWRSTNDLKYKGRETWRVNTGDIGPQVQQSAHHQPGLPGDAYHFSGNNVLERINFQVGDRNVRRNTPNVGTPDFNRSTSMEMWVRFDTLGSNQILLESGNGTEGISITLGDADLDGVRNDIRFRVLGTVGAESGATGVVKQLTVDAKADRFVDLTADYVHLAAVFNDDPTNRYAEIYVNGALAGRVNGLLGSNESIRWDSYDYAGLGNVGGAGLGGNGGPGPLPFSGSGFRGDMKEVRFYNHAISASDIQSRYNSALYSAEHRVVAISGDTEFPAELPTNVSINQFESENLRVMHERTSMLAANLTVDARAEGGMVIDQSSIALGTILNAGTKFSSYLLQHDPLGSNAAIQSTVEGTVTFAGRIAAILWDSSSLLAADKVLGTVGDLGTIGRGLDFGASDFLSISHDLKSLSFDLTAQGNEMIQFRVLVAMASADFNLDGYVDGADLEIWQTSYGIDGRGDANGDGKTDGRDFLAWQREFSPNSSQFASHSAVPEPSSALLAIGLCAVGLGFRRRVK